MYNTLYHATLYTASMHCTTCHAMYDSSYPSTVRDDVMYHWISSNTSLHAQL